MSNSLNVSDTYCVMQTCHYIYRLSDDELEVRETDISNGVDYKSPQVWINAFNRRHQESGLVPGNFLQFVGKYKVNDILERCSHLIQSLD